MDPRFRGEVRCAALLCLAVLAASGAGCDRGGGPDGGGDGAPDGAPDGNPDGAPDADRDAGHPACVPGEQLCVDGAVRRCAADGASSELVRDCSAEPPFERCELGGCTMDDVLGPCCTAAEPFCRVRAELEGKDPREVAYRGLWDGDGFACAGSLAADGYNWSLWSRVPACTGPFVRVILSGYLDGWEAGRSYPLCRTASSAPAITVLLTADETTYGNEDPAAGADGVCPSVTGTVAFHEWGAAPGEPFRIELDGRLLEPRTGETRGLRLESHGRLIAYP